MIKLNPKNTAPDYTEYGSVSTDCVTVGQFMTEAAAIYGSVLTIKVDGSKYEFSENSKIRVTDNTPLDFVTYASTPGSKVFNVKIKPKPKTVKKSGWVNLFRLCGEMVVNGLYDSKEEAEKAVGIFDEFHVATVCVDWEEVEK